MWGVLPDTDGSHRHAIGQHLGAPAQDLARGRGAGLGDAVHAVRLFHPHKAQSENELCSACPRKDLVSAAVMI